MRADPTADIKPPKQPERVPKALPQEWLNRMLDLPVDGGDPLAVRDHALFELMYGSGFARERDTQQMQMMYIWTKRGYTLPAKGASSVRL